MATKMRRPLSINVKEPELKVSEKAGRPRKLSLMLDSNETLEPVEASFEVSANGTFVAGGFALNKQGIYNKEDDSSRDASKRSSRIMSRTAHAVSVKHHSERSILSRSQAQRKKKDMARGKSISEEGGSSTKLPPGCGALERQLRAPPPPPPLNPKDIIYFDNIGAGASGFVRKAFHAQTVNMLAVKSVDIYDKSGRHQIVKELKAFDLQSCQYLVQFIGAYFSDNTTKLALEFMNRGDLKSVNERYGPLNEEVLKSVAKQGIKGLQYLHGLNKVHRDIKPANILVNHLGEVKFSDFGLLSTLESSDDKCTTFVGTQDYMSPERIKTTPYSYPSDIWSFGLSLITIAYGKFPYEQDDGYFGLMYMIEKLDVEQLDPEKKFSPTGLDFIKRCMAKDPTQRATVTELIAHPFLANINTAYCRRVKWPFAGREVTKEEEKQLHVIVKAMIHALYPEEGDYLASLFDLSRFHRLADQVGISAKYLQAKFESQLQRHVHAKRARRRARAKKSSEKDSKSKSKSDKARRGNDEKRSK
jgi:serine/threonine protein kinase